MTQDEAIEAAQKVKSAYPVFKSITPVEKGDRWVFEYVASPEKEHEGLKVEEQTNTGVNKAVGDKVDTTLGLPEFNGKKTSGILISKKPQGEFIHIESGNIIGKQYQRYILEMIKVLTINNIQGGINIQWKYLNYIVKKRLLDLLKNLF